MAQKVTTTPDAKKDASDTISASITNAARAQMIVTGIERTRYGVTIAPSRAEHERKGQAMPPTGWPTTRRGDGATATNDAMASRAHGTGCVQAIPRLQMVRLRYPKPVGRQVNADVYRTWAG